MFYSFDPFCRFVTTNSGQSGVPCRRSITSALHSLFGITAADGIRNWKQTKFLISVSGIRRALIMKSKPREPYPRWSRIRSGRINMENKCVLTCGKLIYRGNFYILKLLYSTLLRLPPLRCTESEDAGIEPRNVATLALAVSRPNHSPRFHPQSLVIIHTR